MRVMRIGALFFATIIMIAPTSVFAQGTNAPALFPDTCPKGISTGDPTETKVRGVSTQGELVALMEITVSEDGTREWQPKKVFFTD